MIKNNGAQMKRFLILFLTGIVLLSINVFAQQPDSPEITIDELKAHIYYLASDELEGRKPGTEGIKKAAEYIRKQLKKMDATPAGDNYYQNFTVTTNIEVGDNNKLSFGDFSANPSEDFIPLAMSTSETITAPVVFVGYGFQIDEDSLKWNDYVGVDVKDKLVMILRGSPGGSTHGDDPYQAHTSLRKKVLTARDHEAAGVLFVSGENTDADDELIDLSFTRRETPAGLPIVHIKRTVADKLLEGKGTIAELEKQLNESIAPNSFEINTETNLQTDVVKIEEPTANVTAIIKGTDPVLKEQYVFIGAHYDHLGYGGPGSGSRAPDTVAIHNGADDNASGTAAAIEVFEKLAAHRNELKRSIIFMAFSGEEMGLLGSKYFTGHPFIDLDKITFMANMDMVGRLNNEDSSFTVGGTGTAIGLEDMLKGKLKEHGLKAQFSSEGYGPSDHASFYAEDIPVMFVFSGNHEDYHKPEDDADLINYEGEKLIADFVYDVIHEIANKHEMLVYQEAGPKEPQNTYRRFKVTLGIMPNVAASDIKGVRADAVMEGRPAYRAGMKKGDVIVALDGKEVNDIYDYMNRLADFKPGDRISVDVMRNDKKVILIVDL